MRSSVSHPTSSQNHSLQVGVGGASVDRLRSRHLARDELGRALVQDTQADLLPLGHHRRHEGSTPLKEMGVDAMHHQFFFIEV